MLLVLLGLALASTPDDAVLTALDAELQRTMSAWAGDERPPYFVGYRVSDLHEVQLSARQGAVGSHRDHRQRLLDVTARVGAPELDNTHQVRDAGWYEFPIHWERRLPIEDDPLAIQAAVWAATHPEIRNAQERFARVLANRTVKVEEEHTAHDFSVEEPVVDLREPEAFSVDVDAWRPLLVGLSSRLDAHPEVESSSATLTIRESTEYILTSEGTRIRQPRTWGRIALYARATAEDGMSVSLYRWQDVHGEDRWPDGEELEGWADGLRDDLVALRSAPKGDPYTGPVLLHGAAAGVFIHEVLGHRSEGHRQKDADEGHTFRDKVGQQLLPTSISIIDDPTVQMYAGHHLNGYYRYDQEGVPAQPAPLVENGVYKGFLMGRSPVDGFPVSNGHGRAQAGYAPVARMANTIVSTTDPRPRSELRARLLEEARAQGREYGLVIDEIGGGFTLTGRFFPNTFNVRATYATKVYVDGRPDELIRGVDLVGTPLVALTHIIGAGDDPGVFNGFCGAESGMVPNSAVSPSLLIRQLEAQKKESGADRPPVLPKPDGPVGGDS